MRDLEEGSYFCFTDQSMAALVWLRAAMLSSVPGVEIHLSTPPTLSSSSQYCIGGGGQSR